MRWEVRIQGPEPVLKQVGLAVSDEDIRLAPRDGAFVLSGSRLDSLADAASVRHEAGRIVTLLSSSARLTFGSTEPLTIADVAEARPGHASSPIAAPPESSRQGAPAASLGAMANAQTWAQRSSLSRSVRSALANPAMERALALRDTQTPGWADLAQLFMAIEGGLGGPAATARFGLTDSVRKQLLRGTAPSAPRGGAGAQADGDSTPQADRLSLKDALRFLDRLLMTWLASATVPPGR